MIWMSNGMPPTSGHFGKVRGCCQATVPVDLSFLCTQQICRWHPWATLLGSDICQPFLFFCNSVTWLHAMNMGLECMKWPPAIHRGKQYLQQFVSHFISPMSRWTKRNPKKTLQCPHANLCWFAFFSLFIPFFDEQNVDLTVGQTDTKRTSQHTADSRF